MLHNGHGLLCCAHKSPVIWNLRPSRPEPPPGRRLHSRSTTPTTQPLDNGSKWQHVQRGDPDSSTSCAFHQLNYGWMHLTEPGRAAAPARWFMEPPTVIYLRHARYLSIHPSIYLYTYLSSPLSAMIYSSTLGWSHQPCAGLSRCHPPGHPFIWRSEHHFSGFHGSDRSTRRHSSSNYPPPLAEEPAPAAMEKCCKVIAIKLAIRLQRSRAAGAGVCSWYGIDSGPPSFTRCQTMMREYEKSRDV